METAVDLASKVVGVLAALLGLAGYVLVLGAAILWLRLHEAHLPTAVPISLATKGELIATGAQAVAVWALLVVALLAIGAWIVTGDPKRRPFGYVEAGLALSVALSTLLALESGETKLLAFPLAAAVISAGAAWYLWPSGEEIVALLLPTAAGAALAKALSAMSNINHAATMAGAIFVFGSLVLLTPSLQRWRARQDANQLALATLNATDRGGTGDPEGGRKEGPLKEALERSSPGVRSPRVLWVGRAAVALVVLITVGAIAVASQVKRSKDFNEALLSLTNGDCVQGTFITRNSDLVVLGEPDHVGGGEDPNARLATIPAAQILALHIFGADEEGPELIGDEGCAGYESTALVRPAPETTPETKGVSEP
jgi:hypothetical protein